MTFLAPERLLLLLIPLLLAAAYIWAQRRRESYAMRFTNLELLDKVAPDTPGWRRHVPAVALLAAVVALALATARPATSVEVAQEEATVILAVDVSLSMDAEDVEPNRLDAAKEAAFGFMAQVPEEMRVGLVAFAGNVRVLSPPHHRSHRCRGGNRTTVTRPRDGDRGSDLHVARSDRGCRGR